MNILSLDIGTKCGWAVADEDAPPLPTAPASAYGKQQTGLLVPFDESAAILGLRHYHHGLWRGPEGDRGRFQSAFARWLVRIVETYQIGLIGVEASVEGWLDMASRGRTSPDTIRKLIGMTAVVDAVAYDGGARTKDIPTSSMQLHAVGTGRDRDKVRRKDRITALGLNVDHNTGDAIFALSWLLNDLQSRRREAA